METTRTLEARAAKGDADAIFRLGHRLAYGRRRPRPEPWAEIRRLWRRALALGLERAHLHLARLCDEGRGVARNERRAIFHYTHAAIAGFLDACFELGCTLRDRARGDDLHHAVNWFAAGASLGDVRCVAEMGYMLHEGLGRRRDLRAAAGWYRRAARRGNANARYNLALCYLDGDGVEPSARWARHWMEQAAAAGHAKARRWLRREARPGQWPARRKVRSRVA